eukprot:gene19686-biopygen17516
MAVSGSRISAGNTVNPHPLPSSHTYSTSTPLWVRQRSARAYIHTYMYTHWVTRRVNTGRVPRRTGRLRGGGGQSCRLEWYFTASHSRHYRSPQSGEPSPPCMW